MRQRSLTKRSALVCGILGIAFHTACLGSKAPPQTAPEPAPAVPEPPKPTELQYSLPKTMMVLEVQVQHATETPGKYCDFLDLFFPDLKAAAACQAKKGLAPGESLVERKVATSVEGYSVALKGTPDTSRLHTITFDSSWRVERSDSLTFTETGTLTGADVARIDHTTEIVLGVISNIAKIAGRFVFGSSDLPQTVDKSPYPWDHVRELKANFDLLDTKRQDQYKAFWNAKTEAAEAQRQRLRRAVRSFEKIKLDLGTLDSVINNAAPGLPTAVTELRTRIADRLTADFLGSKSKDTWTPTYEITPPAPAAANPTLSTKLFTFAGCGVISDDAGATKNRLDAVECDKPFGAEQVTVAFTITPASGQQASRLTRPDDPAAVGVLYYLRPEAVKVNLEGACSAGTTLLAAGKPDADPTIANPSTSKCSFQPQNSLLAQWGTQGTLPNAGKDFAYAISLYEATGSLKSIKLTTKAALDKGTIDTAFGVPTSLLDAKDAADAEKKKKADEAAAKTDELNVLTRTRQILDEKAKIQKLCLELGLTNCGS